MHKRILQLRSSGAYLGAESVVVELGKHSSEFGYESIIGVPNDIGDPVPELVRVAEEHGIRTRLFPCHGRLDLSLFSRLRDFVRRERIDLVHCHGYKEDFYARLARLGVPLVATNHLWKRTTQSLVLYAKLDSYLLRYFNHVVAVSEPIRREMENVGVDGGKLSRIPNGVDLDRFGPLEPEQRTALLETLGLREQALCLGMVSSLTAEKGHRYALEALHSLVKEQPQTQLVIVGDGEEQPRLQEQVRALGLEDHVVFAGRRRDIPQLLAMIDVFLLPSLKEGLPMALLEAMAARCAVVASDVGDVATAVQDQETGLLVRPGDSAGLAAALSYVLADAGERTRLGSNARRCIEAGFSSRAMTQMYCELYEQQLRGFACAGKAGASMP